MIVIIIYNSVIEIGWYDLTDCLINMSGLSLLPLKVGNVRAP